MILELDRRASRAVVSRLSSSPRAASWLPALHRVSQTGSYGLGWVALFCIVVFAADGWRAALVATGCVWGVLLVNTAVKLLVRRPRPTLALGPAPTTYSFPSAHTAMAVVGATVMTVVVPELAVVWWGWALVLASSRILLGAHFPLDVLAGALLGALASVWVAAPLIHAAI